VLDPDTFVLLLGCVGPIRAMTHLSLSVNAQFSLEEHLRSGCYALANILPYLNSQDF
jgi:hypothetical protein